MKTLWGVSTAVLVTMCISSCTAEVQEPRSFQTAQEATEPAGSDSEEYRVPENLRNSTIVWSAEPGIDLFGREAQLVRASSEAHQVALTNALEVSYPGYRRVVDEDTEKYYSMNKGFSGPEYGTAFHRIIRIDSIDNGFVAYTCMQLSDIATLRSDNLFHRSISQPFLAGTVTFTHADSGSTEAPMAVRNSPSFPTSSTGIPQWEAPNFDVFSGWNLRFEGPNDNTLAEICHDWGRPLAPDALSEGILRVSSETPPETMPAYPGW